MLTDVSGHGETHGVVKFLSVIEINIQFDEFFDVVSSDIRRVFIVTSKDIM